VHWSREKESERRGTERNTGEKKNNHKKISKKIEKRNPTTEQKIKTKRIQYSRTRVAEDILQKRAIVRNAIVMAGRKKR